MKMHAHNKMVSAAQSAVIFRFDDTSAPLVSVTRHFLMVVQFVLRFSCSNNDKFTMEVQVYDFLMHYHDKLPYLEITGP